jgi:hypothetical protein
MSVAPELTQKIPSEMLAMFQRTSEIISDIGIQSLMTYEVEVKGDSIYLENGAS